MATELPTLLRQRALMGAAAAKLAANGRPDLVRTLLPFPRPADESAWERRIEATRARLAASTEVLDEDEQRALGEVTSTTSQHPPLTRFLYQAVRSLKPTTVLEMGTSVGISGAYIGAALLANGNGRLVTLAGSPARSQVAEGVFRELGLTSVVEIRTGLFSDTLERSLQDLAPLDLLVLNGHHEQEPTLASFRQSLPHLAVGATVLFDDVHRSDGMERAWETVCKMPAVHSAIDLRRVGVVQV